MQNNKQRVIHDLEIQFSSFIAHVKFSNKSGRFDINKSCEKTIANILSIHTGIKHTVLNQLNFPGIDIVSENGISGYQITSELTTNKIKDSIMKFCRQNESKICSSISILFLSDSYRAKITDKSLFSFLFEKLTENEFKKFQSLNFSVETNVLNLSDFLTQITNENDVEELSQISNIIKVELGHLGSYISNHIDLQNISRINCIRKPLLHREEVRELIFSSIKNIEKSRNFNETINLINTYHDHYSSILSDEELSQLYLNKAILYQKNGNNKQAKENLSLFERMGNIDNLNYLLCKAKVISQSCNNPKQLEDFIDVQIKRDILSLSEKKSFLVSCYWRLSILYTCINDNKAISYFQSHKELADPNTYQQPHNIQCAAISKIKILKNSQVRSRQLLHSTPELLFSSYNQYCAIDEYPYLDKCVISNLLLHALTDNISNQSQLYYQKLFFVRKFIKKYNLKPTDEGVAEIFYFIKTCFPEAYNLLFSDDVQELIRKHSSSSWVRDAYLLVEYNFSEFSKLNENYITTNVYNFLVGGCY